MLPADASRGAVEALKPALQLVLACLRAVPRPADIENQRRLLPLLQPQDVLAAAADHHVAGLVWHNLRQLPPGMVDASLCDAFRRVHAVNALRVMAATRDYLRLQDSLAAAGIRVVPFKGMVLGTLLYADPALRNQGDIDVLIAQADIGKASAILREQGFAPQFPYAGLDADRQALVRRIQKDLVFVRPAPAPQAVEMHWRLIHNPHLFTPDFEALWSRSQPFVLGPRTVRTLSNEDSFIYLCAHGSSTAWYRLKWLADLEPFLHRVALDWPLVLERSQQLNCLKAVGLGLLLAERLLGVALPAEARKATAAVQAADLAFALEALQVPACWWHADGGRRDPPRTPGYLLRFWRFGLMLGAGWRYRRESLLYVLVHPEDVRALRLPRWLFWCYPLRRMQSFAAGVLRHLGGRNRAGGAGHQ